MDAQGTLFAFLKSALGLQGLGVLTPSSQRRGRKARGAGTVTRQDREKGSPARSLAMPRLNPHPSWEMPVGVGTPLPVH